jgi:hypothetical protein
MTNEKKKKHGQFNEKNPILLMRGVSHCGLAIYIKKYFKAKEELWKLKKKNSSCKNIIFKKSSKRINSNIKIEHQD